MSIPAIIVLVWIALRLLISAHYHGKTIEHEKNFWGDLIFHGITFGILYWGGFFK